MELKVKISKCMFRLPKIKYINKNDAKPLPRIDSIFENLTSAMYFSTLYLSSGYWYKTTYPSDIEKIAYFYETIYLLQSSQFSIERWIIHTKYKIVYYYQYLKISLIFSLFTKIDSPLTTNFE